MGSESTSRRGREAPRKAGVRSSCSRGSAKRQGDEEDEEGWLTGSDSTSRRGREAPRKAAARSSCSRGSAKGRAMRRTRRAG